MPEHIFPGDSELARRMRDLDWSRTDLGSPERWPDTLRVAVGLCLTSRFPMHVWWGRRLTMLYNDAAISFLGSAKHPSALAKPAREAWGEIWGSIDPLVAHIFSGGAANWCEDVPLNLDRRVDAEEVYVTLSFSPIIGAGGQADGIFVAYTETTDKVIGTRRLETLRKLGAKPAEARTAATACRDAAEVLAENPRDIAFAAIYLVDDSNGRAELCAKVGLTDAHGLPSVVSPAEPDHTRWPLAEVLRSRRVTDMDLGDIGIPGGPELPRHAILLPIPGAFSHRPAGLCALGVSPRLALDDAYRNFFDAIVGHLRTVILEATAYEAQQRRSEALTEALQHSERRYQTLFNSIHEAFVVSDPVCDDKGKIVDFRIEEVNPAFGKLTGLSGVTGRTMRDVDPDIESAWIEDYANVMLTGGSIHTERYMRTRDRWFEVRASRWAGKDKPHLIIFEREITKRKRAEQRAVELMKRLVSLMDNTPLAVVEWDANFVITRWSGHAERVFGWTAAEVVGKRIDAFPLVHEPDQPKVAAAMDRLLDPGNAFVISHNRNCTKEGRVVSCEWYNSVLHDENGDMLAVLSLVLDVTERERTETALRESEARSAATKEAFQLAISGAPIAQSLDVLVQAAVRQTEGDARAAFFVVCRDKTCLRSVPGAGNMPEAYIQLVDGFEIGPNLPACGASAYYGHPVISKDVACDPLWAPWLEAARVGDFRACWSFPMKTMGGRVLGTFAMYYREPRDATPRDLALGGALTDAAAIIVSRHNEVEERQAAEAALREEGRRKDNFMATLAHELRNPLAPIRAAVDVMAIAGDNAVVTARARDTIDRQLRHLTRLVDDLLDVSRVTRGKIELRKERVALSGIVESAVETSRPLIDAFGHTLAVTLPSPEVWLHADMVRVTQVLANLLNNAAKYTRRGGHIALTAEREGDDAVIRVRDDGIGIPQNMLPHVFDMFEQVDNAREHYGGGLGLGLTIVKRLVEMHGGSAVAASAGPGQGSEFTVRLPVARQEPVAERTQQAPSQASGRLLSRRVLVVDDNRDAAESLRLLFEIMGNEVHVAHDGRTALEEAHKFQPALVLLDIGLPGMSGYEVARELRKDAGLPRMVLAALTGWGDEDDVRRSHQEGFDYHLTKPVDLVALQSLLTASARSDARGPG